MIPYDFSAQLLHRLAHFEFMITLLLKIECAEIMRSDQPVLYVKFNQNSSSQLIWL